MNIQRLWWEMLRWMCLRTGVRLPAAPFWKFFWWWLSESECYNFCIIQFFWKNLKKIKKRLDFFRKVSYTKIVRWLVGQAVKTPPSHGGNRGSIPLRAIVLLLKPPQNQCCTVLRGFCFASLNSDKLYTVLTEQVNNDYTGLLAGQESPVATLKTLR